MIGIVGAGTIVSAAHLPAYAKLGYRVAGLYDVNRANADALGARWKIPPAASLSELLANQDIEIVDIAVPPAEQIAIVEAALKAGKHVLAQKPLAPTTAQARRLVELANAAHRLLVVNQQMRWSPIVRAIEDAVTDGRIGRLEYVEFDTSLPLGPGHASHWIANEPRLIVLMNTIHFIDTAQFLLGKPVALTATTRTHDSHLQVRGETGAAITLEFSGGEQALIVDRFNGLGDLRATFYAGGSNGALRGRFGLWTNYPVGADDEIEYAARDTFEAWQSVPVQGRWIPDAFTGPVSELVGALRGGGSPSTTGQKHLELLALVDAVYESAATGRRMELNS